MYREFIYLDMDRVQSILAQLNEGALTQLVEDRGRQTQTKANIAGNVLSWFLPLGAESSITWDKTMHSSKVIHDYSFSLALKSLLDQDMVLEVQEWDRDELPLPDAAFVMVRGEATIIDYNILRGLSQKEFVINSLGGNAQSSTATVNRADRRHRQAGAPAQQQSKQNPFDAVEQFIDAFMANMIIARIVHESGLTFLGPLTDVFLREEIRHLIFKRGSAPQGGWVMLAQVSQIPQEGSKLDQFNEQFTALASEFVANSNGAGTGTDFINVIVEAINGFQEAVSSVSYPGIAVTPIAIYRELSRLH